MKAFGVLLAKELRVEARSREMWSGAALLALLVLVVAYLAWGQLGPGAVLASGVLWIALIFAGTLGLSRNLHRERDRGTWEALALAPVDAGTVYLAKAAAVALVLAVVEALVLPLFALLYNADLLTPLPRLLPVLALGIIGFSAAGTLLAGLSAHARAREVLLPLLLFPLLVPLLFVGLLATQRVLDGAMLLDLLRELEVLAAFDAAYLALGWLTFDYLLSE